MKVQERVLRIIFEAIDEYNAEHTEAAPLQKTADAPLYHRTGTLDSLGLVNLIVSAEQKIEKELGVAVVLADESAVSQEKSPFRSVSAFAEHIVRRVEDMLK